MKLFGKLSGLMLLLSSKAAFSSDLPGFLERVPNFNVMLGQRPVRVQQPDESKVSIKEALLAAETGDYSKVIQFRGMRYIIDQDKPISATKKYMGYDKDVPVSIKNFFKTYSLDSLNVSYFFAQTHSYSKVNGVTTGQHTEESSRLLLRGYKTEAFPVGLAVIRMHGTGGLSFCVKLAQ